MGQSTFKSAKFFVLMFLLFNFICISNANSAIINAASCSQADVQTAVDAASDGDTVVVPAGSCTWAGGVSFSNKAITIMGAGIDQTIIDASVAVMLFSIDGIEGKPFRITGFTLDGTKSNVWGIIGIEGTCKNFRIDHNKFTNMTGRGIGILNKNDSDSSYGVIDHNTFIAPFNVSVQGVSIIGDGNTAWNRPLTLGTSNAVYIEDNTFTFSYENDGALDAYGGARYVFRYNTVTGTHVGHHGLDSGGYRSPHSFEIYENTHDLNDTPAQRAFNFRGGTGVVFNNTFTADYKGMDVTNYRSGGSYTWGECNGGNTLHDGNTAAAGGSGTHNGSDNVSTLIDSTKSWMIDEWVDYYLWNTTDGSLGRITANTASTVICTLSGGTKDDWDTDDVYKITCGYPCSDQIGRSTDSDADGLQDLEPLYEWNNTKAGEDYDISVYNHIENGFPAATDHIVENRDYYNDTVRPGYTPYTYPHPLTAKPAAFEAVLTETDTFSGESVWTKSPGKTYTYYLSSKKYNGYNIKKVIENATYLDDTTSIDLCESTAGSYFPDPSDGTLYVHCTDGSDPDTHKIEVLYK